MAKHGIGRAVAGITARLADLLARARQLAAENPGMAGAMMGGLATLVLGSKSGRTVLGSAAAVGGMALIGGLAYKALQNLSLIHI